MKWPWQALREEVVRLKIDLTPAQEAEVIARERHLHSTYTDEISKSIRDVTWRGGRDLKVRPPGGQDWTGTDVGGQDAGNRGLTAVAGGPDGPGADPECK